PSQSKRLRIDGDAPCQSTRSSTPPSMVHRLGPQLVTPPSRSSRADEPLNLLSPLPPSGSPLLPPGSDSPQVPHSPTAMPSQSSSNQQRHGQLQQLGAATRKFSMQRPTLQTRRGRKSAHHLRPDRRSSQFGSSHPPGLPSESNSRFKRPQNRISLPFGRRNFQRGCKVNPYSRVDVSNAEAVLTAWTSEGSGEVFVLVQPPESVAFPVTREKHLVKREVGYGSLEPKVQDQLQVSLQKCLDDGEAGSEGDSANGYRIQMDSIRLCRLSQRSPAEWLKFVDATRRHLKDSGCNASVDDLGNLEVVWGRLLMVDFVGSDFGAALSGAISRFLLTLQRRCRRFHRCDWDSTFDWEPELMSRHDVIEASAETADASADDTAMSTEEQPATTEKPESQHDGVIEATDATEALPDDTAASAAHQLFSDLARLMCARDASVLHRELLPLVQALGTEAVPLSQRQERRYRLLLSEMLTISVELQRRQEFASKTACSILPSSEELTVEPSADVWLTGLRPALVTGAYSSTEEYVATMFNAAGQVRLSPWSNVEVAPQSSTLVPGQASLQEPLVDRQAPRHMAVARLRKAPEAPAACALDRCADGLLDHRRTGKRKTQPQSSWSQQQASTCRQQRSPSRRLRRPSRCGGHGHGRRVVASALLVGAPPWPVGQAELDRAVLQASAYHSVLVAQHDHVVRLVLQERLAQAQQGGRLVLDDGAQLLVVADQHQPFGIVRPQPGRHLRAAIVHAAGRCRPKPTTGTRVSGWVHMPASSMMIWQKRQDFCSRPDELTEVVHKTTSKRCRAMDLASDSATRYSCVMVDRSMSHGCSGSFRVGSEAAENFVKRFEQPGRLSVAGAHDLVQGDRLQLGRDLRLRVHLRLGALAGHRVAPLLDLLAGHADNARTLQAQPVLQTRWTARSTAPAPSLQLLALVPTFGDHFHLHGLLRLPGFFRLSLDAHLLVPDAHVRVRRVLVLHSFLVFLVVVHRIVVIVGLVPGVVDAAVDEHVPVGDFLPPGGQKLVDDFNAGPAEALLRRAGVAGHFVQMEHDKSADVNFWRAAQDGLGVRGDVHRHDAAVSNPGVRVALGPEADVFGVAQALDRFCYSKRLICWLRIMNNERIISGGCHGRRLHRNNWKPDVGVMQSIPIGIRAGFISDALE
uniref:HECT domain-containing protein n=1 Tax=Macrostomum lignano TaxID=282301 RepID=A0A1I8GGA2_9PLAT